MTHPSFGVVFKHCAKRLSNNARTGPENRHLRRIFSSTNENVCCAVGLPVHIHRARSQENGGPTFPAVNGRDAEKPILPARIPVIRA
jgi:hypothetical protein